MLKQTFKFFITGVVIILLFLVNNPSVTKAADELFFDGEGNLFYITHEKRATSNVRYLTIGWIIKRYDMPINVAGQQYVIVTKTNYKSDAVDPMNMNYVYSYFKSDKSEILGAIKGKYKEWYDILINYGDTVYIDSVMTVVSSGNQLGYLYSGEKYTGEVYFTYEGIAAARSWASKESLKQNFGMKVKFPAIISERAPYIVNIKEEPVDISNSVLGAFSNYSDIYDITKGIPSGEDMYIYGSVEPKRCILKLKKVTCDYVITVPVPVTYVLKWTDYYGVKREETRVIKRNYEVIRKASFYTYENLEESTLTNINISGDVIGGSRDIPFNASDCKVVLDIKKHSSNNGNITGYVLKDISSVKTVEVKGASYLKPTIPVEDYSEVAPSLITNVSVRSDRVEIDGNEILSDVVKNSNGCSPKGSFALKQTVIDTKKVTIPKNTPNKVSYVIEGMLNYSDKKGKIWKSKATGFTLVTVHTPVVCQGSIGGSKKFNQAVKPTTDDVVLGEIFRINYSDFGMHKNIKGYGANSYSKYVGERLFLAPFKVLYKGIKYDIKQRINVGSYMDEFTVYADNPEGEYEAVIGNLAYNYIGNKDSIMEEKANLSIGKYGAYEQKKVRLIGTIRNLRVSDGDISLDTPNLPMKVTTDEDTGEIKRSFDISIDTLGDVGEEDFIEAHYSYFVKDENGNITAVDLYAIEEGNIISGSNASKWIESENWNRDNCNMQGNAGVWTNTYELPVDYITVKKGTSYDEVIKALNEDKIDRIRVTGGNLLVAAEFIRYKDGEPFICYINEENAKKGYCNMWLEEGGSKELPYGTILEIGNERSSYYDYEISGTH